MANLSPSPAQWREHALGTVAARAEAQHTAENFPVALRILPRAVRADLMSLYSFARFVDDVGDESPGTAAERLALLDLIADDVRRLPGAATLPVVGALRPLVETWGTPPATFLDLVEANRVDQRVTAYATFDELLGYCRLSAAPVGRVVLQRAGAATDRNVADSDAVCAGLQVLEHCQDVAEDARAGRVYLPATDLPADCDLTGAVTTADTPPEVRSAVAVSVARARRLLQSGRPLVGRLHGWARIAVAGYVAGGLATADALEAGNYDVLARSIRPAKARTVRHAAGLLRGAAS